MKKKHHYVPRFYLNYFTDNKGFVFVYDKEDNKMFSAKPESIAFEKYYYTIEDETGEADPELIEDLLSHIETYGGQAFKQLLLRETLNDNEKSNLCAFIACMFIRGPNYRSNVENIFGQSVEKFSKFVASNATYFNKHIDPELKRSFPEENISSEEIRKYILEGEYSIKANPIVSLYTGIPSILTFGEIFFNMKWNFYVATEELHFLTCDNPVFMFDPTHDPKGKSGVRFLSKNVEITFPISKDLCAVGAWQLIKDFVYVQAKNQLIKQINYRTISSANRFVYSQERNEKLLDAVSKYKGSSPKMIVS
jgi:hypothetical protein